MSKEKVLPTLPRLGVVTFTPRSNPVPGEAKRGVRSILLANALLPIHTIAGTIHLVCALWGRQITLADGTEYSVSASLPGGRFPVLECDAETQHALVEHVEAHAARWAGFNKCYDTGEALLSGKMGNRRGIARQPERDERPALVKPTGERKLAGMGRQTAAAVRAALGDANGDGAQPPAEA